MTLPAVTRTLRNNLKQALSRGDLHQAEILLGRLKEEDPLSVQTRSLELALLVRAGRWVEAGALAGQLRTLFPSSARIHYLAGRVNYHGKDYVRALEHFEESERLRPDWQARHWLGKTATQLGRFEQAEAVLLELVGDHPQVVADLAWLYERRCDWTRALQYVDQYLKAHPDDAFIQAQQARLRAAALAPDELVEEVDTLQALDEPVPAELLPNYVRGLLETGQGAAARAFVEAHHAQWDARTAASIAWACRKLQAYDLAVTLFLQGLPEHVQKEDYKYLSALEADARRCHREDEVIAAYGPLTQQHDGFYGRIKALEKHRG
jgi:tetratricopeptide (TPR) repeat protein